MTTAQESTNGHRVFPLPGSFPDSQEKNRSEDSPNNNSQFAHHGNGVVERQKDLAANVYPQDEFRGGKDITSLLAHEKVTEAFPANAYHVPPPRYAPKPNSYRYDDFPSAEIDTTPLPERCQFMFSDGRQCTMARSDIHPSLCRFHSEREDQLFGDPVAGGMVVGASLDLPELYSACRDLTTAAGVNRALGQVFRLLAQRRISRQEAATFGHLAQLLLRTISTDPTRIGVPSEYHERGASPSLLPHEKVARSSDAHPNTRPTPEPGLSFRATIASEECLGAPPTPGESLSHIARPTLDAPSAVSQTLSQPTTANNSFGMSTSADFICNSREISTYENAELEVPHNEHLRKNAPSSEHSTPANVT
jgi:hypothetical protein